MEYAKKILKEELFVIKKAIKQSDWSNYREALKIREKRVKDIEEALLLISKNKDIRDIISDIEKLNRFDDIS